MKLIPIGGLLLALWGLLTLDWFKILVGVGIFFGLFFVDLLKKRKILKDDSLFMQYKVLNDLFRTVQMSIEATDLDLSDEKLKIVQSLFFVGMIDAASQNLHLDDRKFAEILRAVFDNIDVGGNFRDSAVLFHQKQDFQHPAYRVIVEGGNAMNNFLGGNTSAVLAYGSKFEQFLADEDLPSNLDELNRLL